MDEYFVPDPVNSDAVVQDMMLSCATIARDEHGDNSTVPSKKSMEKIVTPDDTTNNTIISNTGSSIDGDCTVMDSKKEGQPSPDQIKLEDQVELASKAKLEVTIGNSKVERNSTTNPELVTVALGSSESESEETDPKNKEDCVEEGDKKPASNKPATDQETPNEGDDSVNATKNNKNNQKGKPTNYNNISDDTTTSVKGKADQKPKTKATKSDNGDDSGGKKADDEDPAKTAEGGKKRKNNAKTTTSCSSSPEPKAKKPRCSLEKAKEVYEKMLNELVELYKIGQTQVDLGMLVTKVGYKNKRSDAIAAAKKLMNSEYMATIQKDVCQLTEEGIAELILDNIQPAQNQDQYLEQFWEYLKMKLSLDNKTKSDKAQESAKKIFDQLTSGEGYTKQELCDVTHYGMVRSTGFPEILKAMKEIGFTQLNGNTISFTDKLFPFGRP